jgi:hypothetical protein
LRKERKNPPIASCRVGLLIAQVAPCPSYST